LDCSRAYIGKLEAEGAINGKVMASRSTRPRCLSAILAPRASAITARADADHVKVKTEMLQRRQSRNSYPR
jgi:hypothetical protein